MSEESNPTAPQPEPLEPQPGVAPQGPAAPPPPPPPPPAPELADPAQPPAPGPATVPAPGPATVPGAPAAPGVVARALTAWGQTVRALFAEGPEAAADLVRGAHPAGAMSLVAAAANALVLTLGMVLFMVRTALEYSGTWAAPIYTAGDFVLVVLFCLVAPFLLIAARAGVITALAALRGAKVRYVEALDLAALTFVATLPALAVWLVYGSLPGTVTAVLLGFAMVFTVMLAEGTLYVGLSRVMRWEKSALLVHALLTAAWLVIMVWFLLRVAPGATMVAFSGPIYF